jgi:hypothetical protein
LHDENKEESRNDVAKLPFSHPVSPHFLISEVFSIVSECNVNSKSESPNADQAERDNGSPSPVVAHHQYNQVRDYEQ